MQIALVSPFPPSKSGIADYTAALATALAQLGEVLPVPSADALARLTPDALRVYQIGNNDAHGFVYQAALSHPGIVVLHEANLHHLIAEITIKQGDWNAYMRAVEFDGGATALAYAQAVRRLEVGPDYDGVPMLREVLQAARGLVVHSHFVGSIARDYGFHGPIAVIPHGAWLPDTQGQSWRQQLGVGPEMVLVGIFGHLKPYKRIAESLRAFRRLARGNPFARMILVGEEHPDFPLTPLLDHLDLHGEVQHIGFAPIEDFVGYMAACDIILNLRYPTVGESSGSMLRALGLGKPVLVSEVGSFAEFPDEVCIKIPAGTPDEEELIYEYLRYLCEQPESAKILGEAARAWVGETCNWDKVAAEYMHFCRQIADGGSAVAPAEVHPQQKGTAADVMPADGHSHLEPEMPVGIASTLPASAAASGSAIAPVQEATQPEEATPSEEDTKSKEAKSIPSIPQSFVGEPEPSSAPGTPAEETTIEEVTADASAEGEVPPLAEEQPSEGHPPAALTQLETAMARELLAWAPNQDARGYLIQHLSRLEDTLSLLPEGSPGQRILEMGCYMQLTPLLKDIKGYGEVRGCYYGPAGHTRQQTASATDGRTFSCTVDTFDAERDRYPYPDEYFDAVLCTELFEHLGYDPMHCLVEINRILKPGGCVLLSTPNVCSTRAIAAILTGYHPGFFPAFIRANPDGEVDPRHHREYAPREIQQAFTDAGFAVESLRTGAYWSAPTPEHAWVQHLLEHYELQRELRGECIFALGRKCGPALNRYPGWLYYG